jgi:hypothetical protein
MQEDKHPDLYRISHKYGIPGDDACTYIAAVLMKDDLQMEEVKRPKNLFELDSRAKLFSWGPEERYELVTQVQITNTTPEPVQRLIVTAKNLIIYACFYYPFNITAVMTAFSALELAIRLKAENGKIDVKLKGLHDALRLAVDRHWISDQGLSVPSKWEKLVVDAEGRIKSEEVPLEKPYVEILVESMPKTRNALAHGSNFLHNSGSLEVRLVTELINQIYPDLDTISP